MTPCSLECGYNCYLGVLYFFRALVEKWYKTEQNMDITGFPQHFHILYSNFLILMQTWQKKTSWTTSYVQKLTESPNLKILEWSLSSVCKRSGASSFATPFWYWSCTTGRMSVSSSVMWTVTSLEIYQILFSTYFVIIEMLLDSIFNKFPKWNLISFEKSCKSVNMPLN